MNQALSARAVSKWEGGIEQESHSMLLDVFRAPKDFVAHLNR